MNIYPSFNNGRTLKKEMFENIRDYPKNFIDIKFKDYSKGIISGAEVLVEGNFLIIKKGIVKYENRIYILKNNCKLSYYPTEKDTLIKIRFIDKAVDSNFEFYSTEIFLDQDTDIKRDELELGRFKLRKYATLRADYKDFESFSNEYNTVNIINVEYAGFPKSTLSHVILKYFSLEILKSGKVDVYDVVFSMQCMNENIVSREVILNYIANRFDMEYKEYSNLQIYKHLSQILKEVKSGMEM